MIELEGQLDYKRYDTAEEDAYLEDDGYFEDDGPSFLTGAISIGCGSRGVTVEGP